MQGIIAPPRHTLTSAQVITLLRDDPSVEVKAGCELIDRSLTTVRDFIDDFPGGSVSRNSYATLHGTSRLFIATELPWPRAIVRPYIIMSGSVTARFNLGAYYTSAPRRSTLETPIAYEVAGYDILKRLAWPTGGAVVIKAGAFYLTEVENILRAQGFPVGSYVIDQTRATSVLPGDRVWPLDQKITWLTVVNDLLLAIGYQGAWSDWDGRIRCESYTTPSQRMVEWEYTTDLATSMVHPERILERDYFETPNRWTFVRNNEIDGPAPVLGNGIYVYVNQYTGDTSVEGRGGDVYNKVEFLEAADHASLVARAQQTIDADQAVKSIVRTRSFPNPLHWHFDRTRLLDSALGTLDTLDTNWTLPLTHPYEMTHEWTLI